MKKIIKAYVILSDYFPALNDELTECGVFQGVYPTKDKALSHISDMIHFAQTVIDPEIIFYRCKTEMAKKKEAVVLYCSHTDIADRYLYIRECDMEEIKDDKD